MSHSENFHRRVIEGNLPLFAVLTTAAITVGGVAEIVPLYTAGLEPQALEAIAPYTALEVAGRDIYVREGCYNCHSQMIRPFRSETLRYGPWTRAEEYAWDRPFQLGSRRIGPDLQRVGGKYPDAWHYEHMRDPRSTSPGSIMPAYPWLLTDAVDPGDIEASMVALQTLGTPYSVQEVANTAHALTDQGEAIVERLASAGIQVEPDREIVAMIAYLQRLGVDGRAAIAEREAARGETASAGGGR